MKKKKETNNTEITFRILQKVFLKIIKPYHTIPSHTIPSPSLASVTAIATAK